MFFLRVFSPYLYTIHFGGVNSHYFGVFPPISFWPNGFGVTPREVEVSEEKLTPEKWVRAWKTGPFVTFQGRTAKLREGTLLF